MFREHGGQRNSVLDLFGVKHTPSMLKVAESALQAKTEVFYFDPKSGTALDISSLDPGSKEVAEAGWGGLTFILCTGSDVVVSLRKARLVCLWPFGVRVPIKVTC